MTIMYGVYSGVNLDYGTVLWAQLVHSTLSSTRHNEISCARFWTIFVQRTIDRLRIPEIEGPSMANIQVFHTTNIIFSDTSQFTFIESILEMMLRNVPAASEVIRAYCSLSAFDPRPMTSEV